MAKRLLNFVTSLRLTVACLALALVLVFVGTIAQVEEGLYNAQARYFKSFFIRWTPPGTTLGIPIFPGGYLVGSVLLVNLLAAHAKRFQPSRKKIGIFMIHAGLILLLLGQLFTDVLSRESAMRMTEGETKFYSEDFHANELVVIDKSDPNNDEVVAIPERRVAGLKEIRHEKLPFMLRILNYWPNSSLTDKEVPAALKTEANQGVGRNAYVIPRAPVVSMNERNLPSAVVEVVTPANESLGRWLVSSRFDTRQSFEHNGRTYEMAMRFTRYYKPFSLRLEDFAHDKYKGTEIPKNFSSLVQLQNPATGEDRKVKIFMNNPLRYAGLTFYQAGFDENNPHVTILQVVRNPSWLTPYFACVIVGLGLVVQFMMHLVGFISKRRNA